MAVIQGTYGDTGTVSTNARVGQNIKTSDKGRGVISRVSLGKHQNIDLFQAHHHLSSSEFRQVRGAGFTSRVPGADSEAPLLQRHRWRVSQREREVGVKGGRASWGVKEFSDMAGSLNAWRGGVEGGGGGPGMLGGRRVKWLGGGATPPGGGGDWPKVR